MGRDGTQERYLVTPPASTFLAAQASDALPILVLGPSQIPVEEDVTGRRRSSSASSALSPLQTSAKQARRPLAKKARPSRKTTHSQIEKRRREKINDTMQRLKDLVPACHAASELNLRKLDVLTATADYIEELQKRLRLEPVSPASDPAASSGSISPYALQEDSRREHRRSSRPRQQRAYAESPISNSKEDSEDEVERTGSPTDVRIKSHEERTGHSYQQPQLPRTTNGMEAMQDEEYTAAESLIQIAESPMLGPMTERHRLSISELMHLS